MANTSPLSFLVLLALCIVSISAANVFVSIDCGSSNAYKDENLIEWTGDDSYTKNGESRSVSSINSISHVMDTLRVFTNRKKNCYSIDSIPKGRVLVRASFYYGNYDKKSSPPTFDLQFDGNHWATVETSSTGYVEHEVIYDMQRDAISVCVGQTNPGQFPFISALEVRGLESIMYNHTGQGYPLFKKRRFAYGTNSTIRYADDIYDRIWTPVTVTEDSGLQNVESDANFDGVILSGRKPPPAVVKHAVTPINTNSSIHFLFTSFPAVEIPVYILWYFSEVTQLRSNETRSFRIFKNNEEYSEPVFPPYKNVSGLYAITHVSSNTTFSLTPTNDSTLPPLINAMEVYLIGDALTNGTNVRDVAGLASLQKAFTILQDWTGDPCLPAPYTWDWINCSNETRPRVTSLFLNSFGLSGVLPDFSFMDALQTIDLHNNSLQGPIPDFLGTLPKLKLLNLGNNNFNGSIPASLSNKAGLNLVVTGNPSLCTSGESCPNLGSSGDPRASSSRSTKNIGHLPIILLGTTIPTFISTWFIIGVSFYYY